MRLSVFSAQSSSQLFIDLQKLYKGYLTEQQLTTASLQKRINTPNKLFFVTLFNARHLGAVEVSMQAPSAQLSLLCVRDITRRRGVGKNLLHEVEKQLKRQGITTIELSLLDIKEHEKVVMEQFMQACGYQLKTHKLIKNI